MSIEIMSTIWKLAEIGGTELLVLLALADFANDEGICWPSLKTVSRKARISERQTGRVIASLKKKGYLSIQHRLTGEATYTSNLYVITPVTLTPPPGDNLSPPGDTHDTTPGDIAVTPPGDIAMANKSSVNHQVKPLKKDGAFSKGEKARAPDPRSKHPAILMVKGITGRYPNKTLWDDIIKQVGDHPDGENAAACYKAWVTKGYNASALTWLTEWYKTGIPKYNGSNAPARRQATDAYGNILEVT